MKKVIISAFMFSILFLGKSFAACFVYIPGGVYFSSSVMGGGESSFLGRVIEMQGLPSLDDETNFQAGQNYSGSGRAGFNYSNVCREADYDCSLTRSIWSGGEDDWGWVPKGYACQSRPVKIFSGALRSKTGTQISIQGTGVSQQSTFSITYSPNN